MPSLSCHACSSAPLSPVPATPLGVKLPRIYKRHLSFEFRICFGFRALDLGSPTSFVIRQSDFPPSHPKIKKTSELPLTPLLPSPTFPFVIGPNKVGNR